MPQIVDMNFRRRKPERFLVSWDNGESQLISPEVALKFSMAPDRFFDEPTYLKLLAENEIRLTKDQMLSYLARRPHSKRELILKSSQKGYSPPAIEKALEDLAAVGLIDDRQFAELYIQNEVNLRPCSRRLIQEKLRQKGIAESDFAEPLERLLTPDVERQSLHKLTDKFLKANRNRHRNLVERLVRHLQGKGFGWDLIQEGVTKAKAVLEEDDE